MYIIYIYIIHPAATFDGLLSHLKYVNVIENITIVLDEIPSVSFFRKVL